MMGRGIVARLFIEWRALGGRDGELEDGLEMRGMNVEHINR